MFLRNVARGDSGAVGIVSACGGVVYTCMCISESCVPVCRVWMSNSQYEHNDSIMPVMNACVPLLA